MHLHQLKFIFKIINQELITTMTEEQESILSHTILQDGTKKMLFFSQSGQAMEFVT